MRVRWAALLAAPAGIVVATWLLWGRGATPQLETAPMRLPSIHAEIFHLDAGDITRRGPSQVMVVRLEQPLELVPYHFSTAGLPAPATVERWAEHLRAPVVFNAGQFDEKLNHLGWLKSNGEWIVKQRKTRWLGLLVSGPLEGGQWSGVIDLEHASERIAEHYRNVVQSMMLVDDGSRVRVRESDLSACRTIVAQDQAGRIVIMVTAGAVTLADLARWIPRTRLGIARAMNLDGGIEAQLAIRTPELALAVYGQYGTGSTVFDGGPGEIRYPLPAVVALSPERRP